jgi:hypothetical protein
VTAMSQPVGEVLHAELKSADEWASSVRRGVAKKLRQTKGELVDGGLVITVESSGVKKGGG